MKCDEVITEFDKIISGFDYKKSFYKIIVDEDNISTYQYSDIKTSDFNNYYAGISRPHILETINANDIYRKLKGVQSTAYQQTTECLFLNSKESKSYCTFFIYIVSEQYLKHYYKQIMPGSSMNFAFEFFRWVHYMFPEYMIQNDVVYSQYQSLRATYPLSDLINNGADYNNIIDLQSLFEIIKYEFIFLHTKYIFLITNISE